MGTHQLRLGQPDTMDPISWEGQPPGSHLTPESLSVLAELGLTCGLLALEQPATVCPTCQRGQSGAHLSTHPGPGLSETRSLAADGSLFRKPGNILFCTFSEETSWGSHLLSHPPLPSTGPGLLLSTSPL